MDTYLEYLKAKQRSAGRFGFNVDVTDLHPLLFDWQKLAVKWALRLGRAALFEEVGLGKTLQQIEWSRQVQQETRGRGLVVCPLAVARQTIREAAKIGVDIEYVRSTDDVRRTGTPITIVNYDMLDRLDHNLFSSLVLDESSILKSYTGKTKKFILEKFAPSINYSLFCTATPAPNDVMELGNHSEGLGVMDSSQMLANWFYTSQGDIKTGETAAGNYKLRPYANKDFWRWVTTWAAIISRPSDLGFSDDGYIRQPLDIRYHLLGVDHTRAWQQTDKKGQHRLLMDTALSATEMWSEKKVTYRDRTRKALEIVDIEPDEYRIIWCDMNVESELIHKELRAMYGPDSVVELSGSDSLADKEAKLDAFSTGQVKNIVTKSEIAGLGLNWQHCARHIFVSVNYKWESFKQCVGRTDRFGNPRQTRVDMIFTEAEQRIIKSQQRKGRQHEEMHREVKEIIAEFGLWRTDRKELILDLGSIPMELPVWLTQ